MNIRNKRLNRKKQVTSFSYVQNFDDGEVLSQQNTNLNEYVVQSSITDIPFEEYVVANAHSSYIQSYDATQSRSLQNDYHYVDHAFQMNLAPTDANQPNASDNDKLRMLDNLYNQPENLPVNSTDNSNGKTIEGNNTINNTVPPPAPISNQPSTNPAPAVTVSVQDFETALGVNDIVEKKETEDDFINDMKAILNGEKVFNSQTKSMEAKDAQVNSQQPSHHGIANPQQFESKHAIFDQIAQSMEYAKAYDLGSVDLDRRFSDFDRINEVQKPMASTSQPSTSFSQPQSIQKEPVANIDSEDFLRDLSAITQPAADCKCTPVAEAPANITNTPLVQPQFLVEGIAVADAIQIGLGAAAIVQAQVSASQGSFSLSYDKAQRLLTNEARQQMPGAQATKNRYSRRLFLISSPRDMAPLATANVIIEWEGNAFGEISTAVIRRDLLTSTEWSQSSANLTITKIDRIPNTSTDPRTWALIFTYEGTYDPMGNGYYEFSGEFEINAFGGMKFNRHDVVPRNMFGNSANPQEFVAKGQDHVPAVPPIPAEQIAYLRSRLP